MDERRPAAQRIALTVMGGVVACLLIAGVVALLVPRSFTTHEAAIGYVLRQRGIAYTRITLEQTRLDTINFYSYGQYATPYGADVIVELPDGRQSNGRVECMVERRACHLYLSKLGLNRVLLPDLTSESRWPWLNWLEQHVRQLLAALQKGRL